MKNRMLVEFTLCKSFGLKPNPIYLSAMMFMHYVVNFPLLVSFTHSLVSLALLLVSLGFTREFGTFTREFPPFTREFPPFTREFRAFTREFGLYS
jgi:hypothetical protein